MRRLHFRSIAQIFFTPEALFPFIVGSTALSVMGNGAYDLLKGWIGETPWRLAGIVLGPVPVFLFCAWAFGKVVSRLGRRPVGVHTRPPEKHRGLILLVSRDEPCERAIEFHRPKLERCWMLCSSQTMEIAQRIRSIYDDVCLDEPLVVNDLYNPVETKRLIEGVYAALPAGWEEADIIADYTGMTAHCSVGVALACLSSVRHLQYTPAMFDANRTPIGSGQPIEVRLDWGLTDPTPRSAPEPGPPDASEAAK